MCIADTNTICRVVQCKAVTLQRNDMICLCDNCKIRSWQDDHVLRFRQCTDAEHARSLTFAATACTSAPPFSSCRTMSRCRLLSACVYCSMPSCNCISATILEMQSQSCCNPCAFCYYYTVYIVETMCWDGCTKNALDKGSCSDEKLAMHLHGTDSMANRTVSASDGSQLTICLPTSSNLPLSV